MKKVGRAFALRLGRYSFPPAQLGGSHPKFSHSWTRGLANPKMRFLPHGLEVFQPNVFQPLRMAKSLGLRQNKVSFQNAKGFKLKAFKVKIKAPKALKALDNLS